VPRPGAPTAAPREVRTAGGAYRLRRHAAAEGLCGVAGVQLIAVERLVARPLSDADLRDDYGLTARELAVARLLAAGRTNAEIGEALGISPFTARNHAERVMAKLGVSNRARVAALLVAA
jgi:DNA-binding CsgD family transcriptional regulator